MLQSDKILTEKEQAILCVLLGQNGDIQGGDAAVPRLPAGVEKLTPRERDVLPRMLAGLTTKQIGRELELSPKTITACRARILRKLGAPTSMHLSHLFHGQDVTRLLLALELAGGAAASVRGIPNVSTR